MKMLDDLISGILDQKEPVSQTLRRCLNLAYELKNDALKTWILGELNGYSHESDLPAYRKSVAIARGYLVGLQGILNDQPLAASVMKPEHQHWASEVKLLHPIAAYEVDQTGMKAVLPWPQDLVTLYQTQFFEGWVLNRAWIEVPSGLILGLVDSVRTRLLNLALEIRADLPSGPDSGFGDIPESRVRDVVNVTILGGQQTMNFAEVTQNIAVVTGDFHSLRSALLDFGVPSDELPTLEADLKADAEEQSQSSQSGVGARAGAWIKNVAPKVTKAGVKIATDAGAKVLQKMLENYLGLS
ncbi:hypothetical protein [Rhizobium sp. BR 314]|uniref:AbiTii domain-containing protein n=1 Tax=Rhizobium sp. BR 314 TaxID=3040013 RepID=UPI0039BF16E1